MMINDPQPTDQKPDEEAEEMEEVQKDAAEEREGNGDYQ
jgi:hypothetical protein